MYIVMADFLTDIYSMWIFVVCYSTGYSYTTVDLYICSKEHTIRHRSCTCKIYHNSWLFLQVWPNRPNAAYAVKSVVIIVAIIIVDHFYHCYCVCTAFQHSWSCG